MSGRAPGPLRSLLHSTSLYAVSNLMQRGATFLLVPLYARHFTTAEFGAMDQIYQGALVLLMVATLGMPQGLVRGIHLDTSTEEERRRLVGALAAVLVPATVLLAALVAAGRGALARLLFGEAGGPSWIALGAGYFLALSLYQMPMELLKVRRQAAQYVTWSLTGFVLFVAGNLYFIVGRERGLVGMLLAGILAYGAVAIVLWARALGSIAWNLEWRRLGPLLAFGLPMMPALLGRKVLEIADRYMIPVYHDLDTLGIYVMAAKVAAIVEALVLVPFLYAWQPFFYERAGDPGAPRVFARATHAVMLALATLVLALTAGRDVILDLLGHGRFAAAGPMVPVLLLAVACNGLQYCVSAGIHLTRRLVPEMGIMLGAAALNLVLNVVLIPPLGGMGAAIATLAAYAAYLVGTFVLAQRVYPISYPWGRFANIALQTLAAGTALAFAGPLGLRLAIVALWLVTCPLADLLWHGDLGAALGRPRGAAADGPEAGG
jgi:O-antigen/teichoic acid export membrane protein